MTAVAVNTTTHTFRVTGMHCGSCAVLIDDILTDLDGVVFTQTSMKSGCAVVRIDPDRCTTSEVLATIARAGYRAEELAPT